MIVVKKPSRRASTKCTKGQGTTYLAFLRGEEIHSGMTSYLADETFLFVVSVSPRSLCVVSCWTDLFVVVQARKVSFKHQIKDLCTTYRLR